MKSLIPNKALLTPFLFTMLISACHTVPTAQQTHDKDIAVERRDIDAEATVANVVSNPGVRDFVVCQVRSAIWGGFDATVDVESTFTPDKKARSFSVKGGRLTVTVSDSNLTTRASREGLVRIGARQDAFSKGVPFFIDEIRFEAPKSLSFQMWSNPAITIKNAAIRIQSVTRGESGYVSTVEIVDANHSVASQPEPRTITLQEDRLDGWVLSLVIADVHSNCLVSNEVELASLLAK